MENDESGKVEGDKIQEIYPEEVHPRLEGEAAPASLYRNNKLSQALLENVPGCENYLMNCDIVLKDDGSGAHIYKWAESVPIPMPSDATLHQWCNAIETGEEE